MEVVTSPSAVVPLFNAAFAGVTTIPSHFVKVLDTEYVKNLYPPWCAKREMQLAEDPQYRADVGYAADLAVRWFTYAPPASALLGVSCATDTVTRAALSIAQFVVIVDRFKDLCEALQKYNEQIKKIRAPAVKVPLSELEHNDLFKDPNSNPNAWYGKLVPRATVLKWQENYAAVAKATSSVFPTIETGRDVMLCVYDLFVMFDASRPDTKRAVSSQWLWCLRRLCRGRGRMNMIFTRVRRYLAKNWEVFSLAGSAMQLTKRNLRALIPAPRREEEQDRNRRTRRNTPTIGSG